MPPSLQINFKMVIYGVAALLIIGGSVIGFFVFKGARDTQVTSSTEFVGEFFLTKKECETTTERACSLEVIPPSVSAPQIPFLSSGEMRTAWTPKNADRSFPER